MGSKYAKIKGLAFKGVNSNPENAENGDLIYRKDINKFLFFGATKWNELGSTGIQGNTGLQGATGLQGIQGNTGLQGLRGNTGIQGDTGLRGIAGLQGATGIQGIQGDTGIIGLQGIQGNTGLQGIQGATGLQGDTGIQGVTGPSSLYNNEISTTTNITTTNTGTRSLLTGFTTTPPSGTYLVIFNGTCSHTANGGVVNIAINVGGIEKADSVRSTSNTSNRVCTTSTSGKVTVNGSQAVSIYWNITTSGTGTLSKGTLNLIKVG